MQFADSAREMRASAARYSPESMYQVYVDMGRLPEALGDVAAALKITVQKANEQWPVHPSVTEYLAKVYELQCKVAELSAEVGPAMRKLHEDDLRRHEQPRRNESMWDVKH